MDGFLFQFQIWHNSWKEYETSNKHLLVVYIISFWSLYIYTLWILREIFICKAFLWTVVKVRPGFPKSNISENLRFRKINIFKQESRLSRASILFSQPSWLNGHFNYYCGTKGWIAFSSLVCFYLNMVYFFIRIY